MSSHGESARSAQLRKVFLKALDVTIESVRPSDIRECFSATKDTIGHSLDGTVVKQLGKMKTTIEVISHDLPRVVLRIIISCLHRLISQDAVKSTTYPKYCHHLLGALTQTGTSLKLFWLSGVDDLMWLSACLAGTPFSPWRRWRPKRKCSIWERLLNW